jgi:hypothetical protein
MIHELLLSPTETASGSHPCCVVSVTYHRLSYFHGGNMGSNPVGDANKTRLVVGHALRVDWAVCVNDKQMIEAVQKEGIGLLFRKS